MKRRVGVHGARDHFELRFHANRLRLVVAHDAHGADALSVQAHVFGEGLRDGHLVPILDKDANRLRVELAITGRESLVRHVEERKVSLGLHELGDLLPLLRRRVDAGGVVRARVLSLIHI